MRQSRFNVWVTRNDGEYVFNTASGALLRLGFADYKALNAALEGDDHIQINGEVLRCLIQGGMIVSDSLDEIEVIKTKYSRSRESTHQLSLTILTSSWCNFDCEYCFEEKSSAVINDNIHKDIVKMIDQQAGNLKSISVTWFGGEPLIGKKALVQLSDLLIASSQAHGIEYSADLVTNGYLLDRATCLELHEKQVRSVQITLDGPPRIHDKKRRLRGGGGTFSTIIEHVKHATEYFSTSIRVNIDKEWSLPDIEQLFYILEKHSLRRRVTVSAGHLAEPARQEHRDKMLSRAEFANAEFQINSLAASFGFSSIAAPVPAWGAPCTAVRRNEMVIGVDGQIYKCWRSVGKNSETIGHIKSLSLSDGSSQGGWLDYDPFSDPECRKCRVLPICMGGCAFFDKDGQEKANRCSSTRYTLEQQLHAYIEAVKSRQ